MSQLVVERRIGDLISRGSLLFVFGMILLGLEDPKIIVADNVISLPVFIFWIYAGIAFLVSLLFFLAIRIDRLAIYLQDIFDHPVSTFQRLVVVLYWFAFLLVLVTGLIQNLTRFPSSEYLQIVIVLFGLIWMLAVGYMFAYPALSSRKGATKKEPKEAKRKITKQLLTKWLFPWYTYRWLEWVRFSLGIAIILLGKFDHILFSDTVGISVWAYATGGFILFHLLIIDGIITKLEIPEYVRIRKVSQALFTMKTTRYWMETVRTLTYWTIAISGVVIGVIVRDIDQMALLAGIGLVALSLAIVCGFFYNISLISAINTESGDTLTVNRRRFGLGYVFFNIMFTAFVSGIVALVLDALQN